jgi:hypothetical protein
MDASSPQIATLLARQRSYTRSAEIISVPTDALSPQLATLLARQRSYMRSAEIISVPTDADEVLTRQCPCLGLSIHGAYVGAWRIRRFQTETEVHTNLPRFSPPEGKDLHPACLILYCLYNWSCYNGVQMGYGYGRKRDGVC